MPLISWIQNPRLRGMPEMTDLDKIWVCHLFYSRSDYVGGLEVSKKRGHRGKARGKLHTGPKGGKYRVRKGRKVYVK